MVVAALGNSDILSRPDETLNEIKDKEQTPPEISEDVERSLYSFISGQKKKLVEQKVELQSHVCAVASIDSLDSLLAVIAKERKFQCDQTYYAYKIDSSEGCSCQNVGMKVLDVLRRKKEYNFVLLITTIKRFGLYPPLSGSDAAASQNVVSHVLAQSQQLLEEVMNASSINTGKRALFDLDELMKQHRLSKKANVNALNGLGKSKSSENLFKKKQGLSETQTTAVTVDLDSSSIPSRSGPRQSQKYSKNHFKYEGEKTGSTTDNTNVPEEEVFTQKLLSDVDVNQMCENERALEDLTTDAIRTLKALRQPSDAVQKVLILIALLKNVNGILPTRISSPKISVKDFKMPWSHLKNVVLTTTLRMELVLLHQGIVPEKNLLIARKLAADISVDEVRRSQPGAASLLEYGQQLLGIDDHTAGTGEMQHAVLSMNPNVGLQTITVEKTYKIQKLQKAMLLKQSMKNNPPG